MLKLKTYFAIALIVWNVYGSQAKTFKDVTNEIPLDQDAADQNRSDIIVPVDSKNNLISQLKDYLPELESEMDIQQISLEKSLKAQDLNETLDRIQDQQVNIQKLLVAQLGIQINLEKGLKTQLESFMKAIPENFEVRLVKMEEQQSAVQESLRNTSDVFERKLVIIESNQKVIQTKIEAQKTALLDNLSRLYTKVVSLQFERIASRLFFIDRKNKYNWNIATSICREMGGFLAAIKDQEELDAIKARLDGEQYWLGINDILSKGNYVSTATGKKAKYLRWQRGEPNNDKNNEHCVEIVKGEMNDINCSKKMYIICQADNII